MIEVSRFDFWSSASVHWHLWRIGSVSLITSSFTVIRPPTSFSCRCPWPRRSISVVCGTGVLVHMGGWPLLLVLLRAYGRSCFPLLLSSMSPSSHCCLFSGSASPHLCLVAICATADVHDVYELMRALSLIKVQNHLLASSMQCDV
jgi:hypothetical protein